MAAPAVPPLAVIVGPTASGKSALAMAIAARLPVEIVVADSRQVYRGLTIGTAKPTDSERAAVPHHLLDLAAPDERFTLADWLRAARAVLPAILGRGRLPLVVGGTPLYVQALIDAYELAPGEHDPQLRARLDERLAAGGLEALAADLARLDPAAAGRIDLRNPRRVLRALERAHLAGSGGALPPGRAAPVADVVLLGIDRPRQETYRRIDARAAALFAGGLLDEVRALLVAGYERSLRPMASHGYAEAAAHLAGELSLEEAVTLTARRTRQYAKRQLSWWRREPRVEWLVAGGDAADAPHLVAAAVARLAQRVVPGRFA